MRHIEVEFQDGSHAFIDDFLLSDLINSKMIRRFYRPSERRWIYIGINPIRMGQSEHRGIERRRAGHFDSMIPIQNIQPGNRPLA
jgi:hypothetical protein